jgi:fructokinase
MLRVGIDLGGTKIEGIALDEHGKELFRKRIPTESAKGYQHILENIKSLYQTMASGIDNKPHTLGMGTPGALSLKTSLLKNSNTVCMNGKPVKADLERMIGRTFAMQNDANCFAMAEAILGAGKGKNMVFGVIMGTGCGGGIVYKGEVWTGIQAIGGEWGHMSIDPNGPVCYCGTHGCVETYISGGGLEKRYIEKYGEKRKLQDIGKDYYAKDPRAVEFIGIFFKNFGRCIANLINILDPDIIVLGGGVSNFEAIYTEGVKEVAKCIFSDSLETPIVKHQIGDSAGVIGAALIGI